MHKTWGSFLMAVALVLWGAGCTQQQQEQPQHNHPIDAPITDCFQCPICSSQWMGKDNGYGSQHYLDEIYALAEGYRAGKVSLNDAQGQVSRIRGTREQFWHSSTGGH